MRDYQHSEGEVFQALVDGLNLDQNTSELRENWSKRTVLREMCAKTVQLENIV